MKKELEELKAKLDKLSTSQNKPVISSPAPVTAPVPVAEPRRAVAYPSLPSDDKYTEEEIEEELEDVSDDVEPPAQQPSRQQRVVSGQQSQQRRISKLPAIQQRIQQMRNPQSAPQPQVQVQTQPQELTQEEIIEENTRKMLIEQERLQNNGAYRMEDIFIKHSIWKELEKTNMILNEILQFLQGS